MACCPLGVQSMYKDIKDSKSYKRDVNDMIEDLGRQNRQLEQWKKHWLVLEETPGSLHLNVLGRVTIKFELEGMRGYRAHVLSCISSKLGSM